MKSRSQTKQQSQALPFFLAAITTFVVITCWASHLLAEKINAPASNPTASVPTAARSLAAYQKALESISAETLLAHVYFLADDKRQGRKPGTQGSRAAAKHIAEEFEKYGLAPGDIATDDQQQNTAADMAHNAKAPDSQARGDYFQDFSNRYRNVVAILPGSDPLLKKEMIVIGAHYDHIGTSRSGKVYNGADDNASGIAGLLELAEAFSMLPTQPRRTILFAAWDGEESGLLGSMHWLTHPSTTDAKVVFMINMDMIGRLCNDRLVVHATRSGFGLRRLLSTLNSDLLTLDFTQQIWMCSDHWSFFSVGVPAIMVNTGRNKQLHTPNDDAELINSQGMQRVARLVFETADNLANADKVTQFRKASRNEQSMTPSVRIGRMFSKWLGSQLAVKPKTDENADKHADKGGDRADDNQALAKSPEKPLKLGIYWRADDSEPGTVVLTHVVPDMPATRAGLQKGDRIYRINGKRFEDDAEFAKRVTQNQDPLKMLVERDGKLRTVEVRPKIEARAQAEAPAQNERAQNDGS